jgi:hypothetical protein
VGADDAVREDRCVFRAECVGEGVVACRHTSTARWVDRHAAIDPSRAAR